MFLNLDTTKLRGQGYDGAANMSGKFRGVQARIQEKFPQALYTHCSSHALNLVVSSSCSMKPIRNTIAVIKSTTKFLCDTHLRRITFGNCLPEKSTISIIKNMCETRWVERHTNIYDYLRYFHTIRQTLTNLAEIDDKAAVYIPAIENSEFLVSLKILYSLTSHLLRVSKYLQSPSCDLVAVYDKIKNIENTFQSLRGNALSEFKKIFMELEIFLNQEDIQLAVPRVCSK